MAPNVERDNEPGSGPTTAASPLPLFAVALVVGLYAMAPAIYLGGLHVKQGAEIVDHVVPGLAVIAMVGVGLSSRGRSVAVMAYSGLVVLLAGLWMVLTHIGLFRQAVTGQVSWGPAAYHCSTAAFVFLVGLTWVWLYRRGLSE